MTTERACDGFTNDGAPTYPGALPGITGTKGLERTYIFRKPGVQDVLHRRIRIGVVPETYFDREEPFVRQFQFFRATTIYGFTKKGMFAVAALPWPSSAKTNTRYAPP